MDSRGWYVADLLFLLGRPHANNLQFGSLVTFGLAQINSFLKPYQVRTSYQTQLNRLLTGLSSDHIFILWPRDSCCVHCYVLLDARFSHRGKVPYRRRQDNCN